MEKGRPHFPLGQVKYLVSEERVQVTRTALLGAAEMGCGYREMLEIIMQLTAGDFYKSMTTLKNHRVWQDVYRPLTPFGPVCLKLTSGDSLLIVSFKEL